ncbi:MAG: VanW family protein [Chloroflexi bacterium]|nr:VanW family protein [Chloroflexota bacterium]
MGARPSEIHRSVPGQFGASTPSPARSALLKLGVVLLPVLAIVLVALSYQLRYAGEVFPGVYALGVDLGGLAPVEASQALRNRFAAFSSQSVTLSYDQKTWTGTPDELGLQLVTDSMSAEAFQLGREGNPLRRLWEQLSTWRLGHEVATVLTFDEAHARRLIDRVAGEIDRPRVDASLIVRPDLSVAVSQAVEGRTVDREATLQRLRTSLLQLALPDNPIAVNVSPPLVTEADLSTARAQAAKALSAPLRLTFEGKTWILSQQEIAPFLNIQSAGREYSVSLDQEKLTAWVEKIAAAVNRPPEDAQLRYQNSQVVVRSESRDGVEVDVPATAERLTAAAFADQRQVSTVADIEPATIRSSDARQIVTRDTITQAKTNYAGSVPPKKHNIELAVSRLDGALIPPGAVFSFNQALGHTRLSDGYQVGYGIILSGGQAQTVPSVAGGICQVATTLFQAAYWAGLEVVERNWHLYWISRYGQPPLGMTGLDATVDEDYNVDLKLRNNTGNWIAIEAKTDGSTLSFTLKGIDPGWKVEVGPPQIRNVVKADPTVVTEEDKTLPPGTSIQVEAAYDGFDVTVPRVVTKDGQVIDRTQVRSSYQPARNVVLVGPKPPEQQEPPPGQQPSP